MDFFKALWDLITNPLITLVLIFAILEKSHPAPKDKIFRNIH